MESIKELIKQETALQERLNSLKEQLAESVRAAGPLPGVAPLAGAENIAIVRLSTVFGQKGNLAPETFIPAAQAKAVQRRLATCTTLQETVKALENMVRTGIIRGKNQDNTTLNPNTINILRQTLGNTD